MAKKAEYNELGFGTKTSSQKKRLINEDGSFNINRTGQSFWNSTSIYHALISMPWKKFHLIVLCYFVVVNLIFTFCYFIAGIDGIHGVEGLSNVNKFWEAFFFSTQTISTVGFGRLSPGSHAASAIAAVESLLGLLGFAVVTGLIYGRFSRPQANILFSKKAIIAPFKDATAFQFRIANKMRNSQISDIEARVTVAKFEIENGVQVRRFRPLELELKKIIFFPMTWTINHPINEDSPLYDMTEQDMKEADVEFLILLTGFDDTFSQTVSTRFSYTYEELVWRAKFISVFEQSKDGILSQNIGKLSEFEVLKEVEQLV